MKIILCKKILIILIIVRSSKVKIILIIVWINKIYLIVMLNSNVHKINNDIYPKFIINLKIDINIISIHLYYIFHLFFFYTFYILI